MIDDPSAVPLTGLSRAAWAVRMRSIGALAALAAVPFVTGCAGDRAPERTAQPVQPAGAHKEKPSTMKKITKTDEEWRKELSPEQYRVLREKGTERAFTGKYWNLKDDGMYTCAGCGEELFRSDEKYDSGCGWPSFYDAPDKSKLAFHEDLTFGMRRVEVTCAHCGGHLGHVFPDGPEPTGQRYCINSASLGFRKKPPKAPSAE